MVLWLRTKACSSCWQVDWDHEKECFESFAAAVADFYAMYPPVLPHPSEHETKFSHMVESLKQLTESKAGREQLPSGQFTPSTYICLCGCYTIVSQTVILLESANQEVLHTFMLYWAVESKSELK